MIKPKWSVKIIYSVRRQSSKDAKRQKGGRTQDTCRIDFHVTRRSLSIILNILHRTRLLRLRLPKRHKVPAARDYVAVTLVRLLHERDRGHRGRERTGWLYMQVARKEIEVRLGECLIQESEKRVNQNRRLRQAGLHRCEGHGEQCFSPGVPSYPGLLLSTAARCEIGGHAGDGEEAGGGVDDTLKSIRTRSRIAHQGRSFSRHKAAASQYGNWASYAPPLLPSLPSPLSIKI